jgi:hypothetical protein
MLHSAEFLQKMSSTTPRDATQRDIQVKIFWSTGEIETKFENMLGWKSVTGRLIGEKKTESRKSRDPVPLNCEKSYLILLTFQQ